MQIMQRRLTLPRKPRGAHLVTAEIVAALHGGVRPDVRVRHDVDEQTMAANLALSQLVAEALERDGLGAWTGAEGNGAEGNGADR